MAKSVRGLLSQSRIEIANLETSFEIQDIGDRYLVSVRGRVREYDDDHRDCVRRARVAAVFVALTLAPPDIENPLGESNGELPVSAPSASAIAPSTAERPMLPPAVPAGNIEATPRRTVRPDSFAQDDRWRFGLELGAVAATAPRADQTPTTLGAEMRWFMTHGHWGLVVGGLMTTAETISFGTSTIQQKRVPFDIGVRLSLGHSWLTAIIEGGPSLAILRLQQTNAPNAPRRSIVELGARAGVALLVGHATIRPFLRGFVEFLPYTHQLAVEPRGVVGRTSMAWLGASVGVSASFN